MKRPTPLRRTRRDALQFSLAAAAVATWPGPAPAQTAYPKGPIKIIVPWPPGGATDVVARAVAQKLTGILQQTVIVDNRPGATGTIGTQALIQSPADGHTLLFIAPSLHIFGAHLMKDMKFDTVADITPITVSVQFPYVLAVSADSPYRSVADLVRAAKAQPGKLAYGSFGIGSGPHIVTELFRQQAGIDALHVPYKGGSQVTAAVMGGEVPFMFESLPSPLAQIRGGKLRALAVTGSRRSPVLPDVPTLEESGLPIKADMWLGFGGPPRLPADVTARLFDAMKQVAADPDFIKRMADLGVEATVSASPEAFRQTMLSERERWGRVIRAAKISAE